MKIADREGWWEYPVKIRGPFHQNALSQIEGLRVIHVFPYRIDVCLHERNIWETIELLRQKL